MKSLAPISWLKSPWTFADVISWGETGKGDKMQAVIDRAKYPGERHQQQALRACI